MPITFNAFPEFDLMVTRGFGLVTNEDLLETYVAVFRDESLGPSRDELAVLTEVAAFDIDLETFRRVSEMAVKYFGNARTRTAVFCRRPMHQAISRLYQSVAHIGETETVCVFGNLSDALAWLERPDFPPERLEELR